jgi:hypothetical protein
MPRLGKSLPDTPLAGLKRDLDEPALDLVGLGMSLPSNRSRGVVVGGREEKRSDIVKDSSAWGGVRPRDAFCSSCDAIICGCLE